MRTTAATMRITLMTDSKGRTPPRLNAAVLRQSKCSCKCDCSFSGGFVHGGIAGCQRRKYFRADKACPESCRRIQDHFTSEVRFPAARWDDERDLHLCCCGRVGSDQLCKLPAERLELLV